VTFIDTNILVYAADDTDRAKFDAACEIVFKAASDAGYLVSAQVVNEFASVLYRKLKKTDDEVLELLDLVKSLNIVPLLPEWTCRAVQIKAQYGLQFFDSLLLAAAEANRCDTILTEDLNDGQVYAGVRAVNPFAKSVKSV